jgi:acetyl-CoA acyltransferase
MTAAVMSGRAMRDAVIVDVVRTASGRGKIGGALSSAHPADLLAHVLRRLVARSDLDPALVDDVITGCVSQVGEQALNVGRSAVLAAKFPVSTPATTIDRQCGSSQQAVHFAAQGVLAGAYDVVIACGVEMMSRVPLGRAAQGQDAFGPGVAARYPAGLVAQGISAELLAVRHELGRDELDDYSVGSHRKAAAAAQAGHFDREIVDFVTDDMPGPLLRDETIRPDTSRESLSGLKPSFVDDAIGSRYPSIEWLITAGNSSPLTDGASAALIMDATRAEQLGFVPRARIHASAVVGSDPLLMLDGVVPATQKILHRSGLRLADIDAYEINEAFAPVPLLWARAFGADESHLNPNGGAIALGHPLGASGTRILATLVNHLERSNGRYGLQVMCEGGGMANATIVERL